MLLCVSNTIHKIRVCSLFVSQSMLPPLPTLTSPHMPVTMMKPETPTWETCTASTGWKTLMWLVHTSDRELRLGPDLRKIEKKSIYSDEQSDHMDSRASHNPEYRHTERIWSHADQMMGRCFK